MTENAKPTDTSDMLLIHRVIRREIGQLPRLFRSAAGDRQRARAVGAHAREMLDFLHTHHSGEDELLYPLLRQRVSLDAALLDRMDAQHAQVDKALNDVRADLAMWTASADAATGERMARRLEDVFPLLLEHLAEEEDKLLPIVARHITRAEWDRLAEHGIGAIPRKRRLVILAHIVEEADESERTRFLVSVPAPARLAYRLIGRRQHAREVATIRG
jgi:hemerythrin-like domain-containing protein